MNTLDEAIATLRATPATLRALFAGASDDALVTPGPEGWSPRDVLAHLLSINGPAFVDRIGIIVGGDNATVPNVDEDQALASSGHRERAVDDLLGRFAVERAEALQQLDRLTPPDYARSGQHSVAGAITVGEIVHHLAYHDLLHTRQICALLLAPIEASRGAMRASFPYDG